MLVLQYTIQVCIADVTGGRSRKPGLSVAVLSTAINMAALISATASRATFVGGFTGRRRTLMSIADDATFGALAAVAPIVTFKPGTRITRLVIDAHHVPRLETDSTFSILVTDPVSRWWARRLPPFRYVAFIFRPWYLMKFHCADGAARKAIAWGSAALAGQFVRFTHDDTLSSLVAECLPGRHSVFQPNAVDICPLTGFAA